MGKRKRRRYPETKPQQNLSNRSQSGPTRTLVFHKPYRVLSSFTDPEGRATVGDFVTVPEIYAAGRLDYDSEGLMILTNDGKLAHRITHPRYKLKKVYFAQVEHIPALDALRELRQGLLIKGKRTRPAKVELLTQDPQFAKRTPPIRDRNNIPTAWLKITLKEGRNRQIRRMTAAVGHPTLRLVRTAIGPITLAELEPGQWRDLTKDELGNLKKSLSQAASLS